MVFGRGLFCAYGYTITQLHNHGRAACLCVRVLVVVVKFSECRRHDRRGAARATAGAPVPGPEDHPPSPPGAPSSLRPPRGGGADRRPCVFRGGGVGSLESKLNLFRYFVFLE